MIQQICNNSSVTHQLPLLFSCQYGVISLTQSSFLLCCELSRWSLPVMPKLRRCRSCQQSYSRSTRKSCRRSNRNTGRRLKNYRSALLIHHLLPSHITYSSIQYQFTQSLMCDKKRMITQNIQNVLGFDTFYYDAAQFSSLKQIQSNIQPKT